MPQQKQFIMIHCIITLLSYSVFMAIVFNVRGRLKFFSSQILLSCHRSLYRQSLPETFYSNVSSFYWQHPVNVPHIWINVVFNASWWDLHQTYSWALQLSWGKKFSIQHCFTWRKNYHKWNSKLKNLVCSVYQFNHKTSIL